MNEHTDHIQSMLNGSASHAPEQTAKASTSRYNAPRFGRFNYYTEHLAQYCTPAEQLTFIWLWKHARDNSVTAVSIRQIARETGLNKATVLAALNGNSRRRGLVAAGLIQRHRAATAQKATRWKLVDVRDREFSAKDFSKASASRRSVPRDPQTGRFQRTSQTEQSKHTNRDDTAAPLGSLPVAKTEQRNPLPFDRAGGAA